MPQGDPGAVMDAVNSLDRMASGFEHSAQGFRRAAAAVPSWLGFASVAFQGLAGSLEQTADRAHTAIREARIATRRYAEDLREARERVKKLQERAGDLEQQIDEAKRRAADAALREQEARTRATNALLSAPFDGGGGVAFDVAAAAFDEADTAAAERRRWEDRIAELEDELERVRREAAEQRQEIREVERRAATAVDHAVSVFPAPGAGPRSIGRPSLDHAVLAAAGVITSLSGGRLLGPRLTRRLQNAAEQSIRHSERAGRPVFRNPNLLLDHHQRHGALLGHRTVDEYQRAAQRVIADAMNYEGNKMTSRGYVETYLDQATRDRRFFRWSTNEFVVLSVDGKIRTYFKPDNPRAYWASPRGAGGRGLRTGAPRWSRLPPGRGMPMGRR